MFENFKIHLLTASVAISFGATLARAEVDGVRDNARFFSARARTEAIGGIEDIGKRFRKDLVWETYSAIPQDLRQGVDLTNKAAATRFYEAWARTLAKQQRVNGIYILLVKEPPHLQIEVGNDTQGNAFTLKDRDALRTLLLTKLRHQQYDDALLESVSFVSTTLQAHLPARGRTPGEGRRAEAPSTTHWLIMALFIGGAVWVVLRIVRAVAGGGGGGGGYSGAAMAPGGGGGFFSNLLGGMFGAAAGMWIYDQFAGRSSSWGEGDAGYRGDNGGNGDNGYSGQDTDYSGTGGDFGDNDSGGGDSGGSDFGGGDSGGGDFGGGGDF